MTKNRLWVGTGGNVTCDEHAGVYLKTAIEYRGNDVFKFDSLVLDFNLCAQCVGENLSASNGFTKAGA